MQESQHDGSPKENAPDCPITQPDADSGYEGSSNASLETHDDNRNASANPAVADGSSHRQPSSSGTETNQPEPIRIRPIAKPIDIATARRANDVIEQMSQLLQEHMVKPRRRRLLSSNCRPPSMSIRAVMLGTTEEDAKTCLVIFCTDSRKSHDRIKDFLRKSFVKDLYQPNDTTVPSFEVHIVGASPNTQAGVKVDIPLHPHLFFPWNTTHCGMSISFMQENRDEKSFATMGGILQLKFPDGADRLFGLTVAHGVVDLTNLDDSDASMSDEDEDYDDDDDSSSELTTIEDYPPTALAQIDWHSGLNPTAQEEPAGHSELGRTRSAIEPIAFSALDDFQGGTFRDWALFPFPSRSIVPKPNMYMSQPLKIPTMLDNAEGDNAVLILKGLDRQVATRSSCLSRILLKPGTEFVRAYTLNMRGDSGIRVCDSGSWVVDCATLEVCGHLVATDILMGVYVIPLVDILDDIRARFQDVSIEFPSISSSDMSITAMSLESLAHGIQRRINGMMIIRRPGSDDEGESTARTVSTASQMGPSSSVLSRGTSSTFATFNSADTKTALQIQADINARNRMGETALHIVVRTGHNLAMRTLVEAGGNVYARDGQGRSVLDVADAKILHAKDVNCYAQYEGARAWLSGLKERAVQSPTFKQEYGVNRKGEL